jgi:uncharacterized membrane protein/protein-disulfide isomerase
MPFNPYDNAELAVINLLRKLSVHVNPDEISDELNKHPDYPSILAVSDVLTNFNIPNSAFRIEHEEIEQLPCPFLAHVHDESDKLILVTSVDGQFLRVFDEKSNGRNIAKEAFNEIFTGVVLGVDFVTMATERKKISIIKRYLQEISIYGLLVCFILGIIFLTTFIKDSSYPLFLISGFKLIGVFVSVMLLIHSLDNNNMLIQKLCKQGGKTNCNAILSSEAANVFEGLSWSEVGFFYFAGSFLLLVLGGRMPGMNLLLLILNACSLPYTFYSIYYQARIAKQWCILCCTVQAVLWFEFFPLLFLFLKTEHHWLSIGQSAIIAIICMAFPMFSWYLFKPMLLKIKQIPSLKQSIRAFKYNQEAFQHRLTDTPKVKQPDKSWSIVLGNQEADHIITMVTNPFCPPCAVNHKLLDSWLKQRDDLQVRIVFTADNVDNDDKTAVSRHLMALYESGNNELVEKALNSWYESKNKNYDNWASKYPVKLNEANYYKINHQKDWCNIADVTFTPTFLINGYRLPENYQLQDIKYLL